MMSLRRRSDVDRGGRPPIPVIKGAFINLTGNVPQPDCFFIAPTDDPVPPMRYDVFVSYSSIQRDWAEVLAHNLKGAGKTVFFDQWELTPGADWVLSLDSALDESRSAVLVASPEAQESGWVREEYAKLTRRRVSEPGFKIIPAVHSGAGHDFPFLGGIQWVDFRDPHPYA
ncbi:MAG: toll/interleukin-1 receptor domain-containing protein [Pseudomonadota bacterium]